MADRFSLKGHLSKKQLFCEFLVPSTSRGLQHRGYVFGHSDVFCLIEDMPRMCLSLVSFVRYRIFSSY